MKETLKGKETYRARNKSNREIFMAYRFVARGLAKEDGGGEDMEGKGGDELLDQQDEGSTFKDAEVTDNKWLLAGHQSRAPGHPHRRRGAPLQE